MNGYLERDNMYKLYIDMPSTIDKHWFNSYLPEGVGKGRFNKKNSIESENNFTPNQRRTNIWYRLE